MHEAKRKMHAAVVGCAPEGRETQYHVRICCSWTVARKGKRTTCTADHSKKPPTTPHTPQITSAHPSKPAKECRHGRLRTPPPPPQPRPSSPRTVAPQKRTLTAPAVPPKDLVGQVNHLPALQVGELAATGTRPLLTIALRQPAVKHSSDTLGIAPGKGGVGKGSRGWGGGRERA